MRNMVERVGIVVPTIGERPEYLPLALESIRQAGNAYVLLIGNPGFDARPFLSSGLIDEYLEERESGLAAKINFGMRALPRDIQYFNWLGDDDLLTAGSLNLSLERITQPDKPVMVYGGCEYIDPQGIPLFTNKSGPWAVALMRYGPQLIPQPGALYSREAFEKVGGLCIRYQMAFDFELFYALTQQGKVVFIPQVLAKFRWHPGSLSVRRRRRSVIEASMVRRSHLPKQVRSLSWIWEFPIREATYWAGVLASNNIQMKAVLGPNRGPMRPRKGGPVT